MTDSRAGRLRQPIRKGTVSTALDNTEIASNFTTFLQLLTTQLKNQDPLSPMDTNQFTQQLVEFADVEQQMKTNDTLSTLVSLQQSAQTSQALSLVGATVVVNGTTASSPTVRRPGRSTPPAGDGDNHDHRAVRRDGLYRHRPDQRRQPDLHLEWRRQRRQYLAGRQLHPDGHRG